MAAALLVSLVVALAVARRGETDQADVAAAARGDQQTLGRLYDRYGRLVFSLALRVVGDPLYWPLPVGQSRCGIAGPCYPTGTASKIEWVSYSSVSYWEASYWKPIYWEMV